MNDGGARVMTGVEVGMLKPNALTVNAIVGFINGILPSMVHGPQR